MGLDKFLKVPDNFGALDGIVNGAKELGKILQKDSSLSKSKLSEKGGYSEDLEKLISMIIEDGEISEKELELLKKKAESEGIDPLEIEIVVTKRLKKYNEGKEFLKNPVNQIIQSFKLAEDCALGSRSDTSSNSLSSILSLIDGVSGVGSIASISRWQR